MQNETKSKRKHKGNKTEVSEGLDFHLVGRLTPFPIVAWFISRPRVITLAPSLWCCSAQGIRSKGDCHLTGTGVCPHQSRTTRDKAFLCLTELAVGVDGTWASSTTSDPSADCPLSASFKSALMKFSCLSVSCSTAQICIWDLTNISSGFIPCRGISQVRGGFPYLPSFLQLANSNFVLVKTIDKTYLFYQEITKE